MRTFKAQILTALLDFPWYKKVETLREQALCSESAITKINRN
jgi:hypothetical protein